MDAERMCQLLPEEPPEGLIQWTVRNHSQELGDNRLVFQSELVESEPDLAYLMEFNSFSSKRIWMARCTCTACKEDFLTHKIPGVDAIRVIQGPDGLNYSTLISHSEDLGTDCSYIDVFDGEDLACPMCQSNAILTHSKRLRGGRKNQIKVVEVRNIDGYTTVLYWLVQRFIDENGYPWHDAVPEGAYVLKENGDLAHFTHVRHGGAFSNSRDLGQWRLSQKCADTIDSIYHDWGSICNRKKGAVIWNSVPDMTATTGEKTGLREYLIADGFWLVTYLKFWCTHRNVENLCVTGFAGLVAELVSTAERFSCSVEAEFKKYIDLDEKKPHKMLRISKEEFRGLREMDKPLSVGALGDYNKYRKLGGKLSITQLLGRVPAMRNLNSAFTLMRTIPGVDLEKLERYCSKTGLALHELWMLVDIHKLARKVYPERELTRSELWPRRPIYFHEQLIALNRERELRKKSEKANAYEMQFARVREQLAGLEWTDGDLSIFLPSCSTDLTREGDILRHCVGSYGSSHIKGEDRIFFVRRYRRPERPYYTLDICMTGRPEERQLHGYGNERHGKYLDQHHSIPKKVRDFCDRWKNEVLIPWYVEQQKNKEAKQHE